MSHRPFLQAFLFICTYIFVYLSRGWEEAISISLLQIGRLRPRLHSKKPVSILLSAFL
jgi:hypothetical protein